MNSKRLNIIAVHGTFAGPNHSTGNPPECGYFYDETSIFAKTLTENLKPDIKTRWHCVSWSGANSEEKRAQDSNNITKFLELEKLSGDDPVVFIAHSHGGNVVFEWLISCPCPLKLDHLLLSNFDGKGEGYGEKTVF